jgi:outer membrane protein assembly factor BamB
MESQNNNRSSPWLGIAITLGLFALTPVVVNVLLPRGTPAKPGTAAQAADAAKPTAQAASKLEGYPMFGGAPARNMANTTDKGILGDFAVEKKDRDGKTIVPAKHIKWVADLGSRAYGGPVIAGGRVYVGTNNHVPRDPKIMGDKGVVMCFSEKDGKFLWQVVRDKLLAGQEQDWPLEGICSTPAVDGERVYFVTNRCEVICANTKDGSFIWNVEMMKEFNVFPHNMSACSPLVVGDTVFIVTANGVDKDHINIPSPEAPSFIALDKHTGKLKWKSAAPGKNIMHGQWSNPAYGVVNGKPQVVFPGGDGWLYAFEPETGKEIWKFDANPKGAEYELGGRGTKSDFIATPVIVDNKVIIATGQDPEHYEGVGHLWCIDMTKTGDVSPELVVDAKAKPKITKKNPNSAALWHYGGPTTPEDREKLQRDYYFGRTMSTVSVHDGLVYVAELAGYVHCLDLKDGPKNGKPYWVHDLKTAVWGSTYWVDNKIFIGTEEGDIWVFAPGKEKKILLPFDKERNKYVPIELGGPVKSTPVAANGVLYVMTESHLYAIAQK